MRPRRPIPRIIPISGVAGVCHIELSLKTKGSFEILSHYRTDSHLVREHRIRMETPGLPLFGKDEQEITGPALVEAREKAELAYPIIPILGESYLLPGQRKLPVPIDELDPSSVVCSQIRILLTGLQQGGDSSILSSLWSNLSLEVRGPVKVPQCDWSVARIFVSISLPFKQLLTCSCLFFNCLPFNIYRVFWSICSAHCSLTLRLPLANQDNFRYNFERNNTIHSLSWSSGLEMFSIGVCSLNF